MLAVFTENSIALRGYHGTVAPSGHHTGERGAAGNPPRLLLQTVRGGALRARLLKHRITVDRTAVAWCAHIMRSAGLVRLLVGTVRLDLSGPFLESLTGKR